MNIIFDFCLHILFLSILPTITKIRCGNLKEYARFGVEFELVLLVLYFGVVFISFLLHFYNVLFLQAFATVVEWQKFQHIPVWHNFSVSGFSINSCALSRSSCVTRCLSMRVTSLTPTAARTELKWLLPLRSCSISTRGFPEAEMKTCDVRVDVIAACTNTSRLRFQA